MTARRLALAAAICTVVTVATHVAAGRATHRVAPANTQRRWPAPARFFFEGDGRLRLSHAYFDTRLNVRYRRPDGAYDPDALAQIRRFFRSREDGREAPIPLRLIELLSYVQNRYHPRQMTLLSGYRSPQFNADLRAAGGAAAQASLHTEGMAADVAFTGLDLRRLWQQLRVLQTGGVGYYRTGKFLHIDTGPPRFWEETTSRVGENLSAGNARIFLRTDFDRYPRLEGAVCGLHSVTAFPVLIARRATLVGTSGNVPVTIEPANGNVERLGECFMLGEAAETREFRIASADAPASNGPDARIVLSTCEPRIEKTPMEITSNPIEVIGR